MREASNLKRRVLAALLERLRGDLASLEASQRAARSGATHEETRAEHPKDTRAIEATYLARGLAERSETLQGAIAVLASLDPEPGPFESGVALLALVTLEDEDTGARALYFVLPVGGGEKLDVDGERVQTLTPASPLGRRLMGRSIGDEVVLQRPRGALHATLVAVR